ncbi:putative bifunctional diguanylate cyclase/phosphodiesterase [Tahibacter harae]|uniref:EAL domain-containing protein n=1 Tax=Tahibacter harae TaxID=2963937 RepID=A0ABT1QNR3_9GAMM|nr:GGDEF domain-containing phosphodiesterase [Tahibacter harae]MCQ4163865.1 EAL domain-containing protein [Tahibacter harae]
MSTRLTRIVLLGTLLIGGALSLGQVLADARSHSQQLDHSGHQALNTLHRAATEAVYEIDTDLAGQVLEGLTAYPGVYRAEIRMFPDTVLARREGELLRSPWRRISDSLFGAERDYRGTLENPRGGAALGELHVGVDTFVLGRDFLARTGLVLGAGLIWAALLGLVLLAVVSRVLTGPLERLADELADTDTLTPETASVSVPAGHEHDELGRLAKAMNTLLAGIRENLVRRAEAEARASYLQQFDDLTGLPNRQLLLTRLGHAVATASSRGAPLALLLLDLCGLRAINDTYGRAVGDDILREFARRLDAIEGVFVARVVEDKFALLLHEGGSRAAVEELFQQVQQALLRPLELAAGQFQLAVRGGSAIYPDDADSAEGLLHNAESALAQAKGDGLGGAAFFDAARDDETATRRRLSQDLRRGSLGDELDLVFDPLVQARSGRVQGMEALLRWQHPQFGLLRPASFIRLAEENGTIPVLGDWVLRQACARAALWRANGQPGLAVSVNVSGAQLRERNLHERVAAVLEVHNLPGAALELEITETAIVDNVKYAAESLRRLRALGVGIAIDDFGTGHASLGYLKELPVTKLKIDMSFVRDVLTDLSDATIVRAIVGLGHSLGLQVAAEGVETAGQRRFLEDIGCDLLQGQLFGCGLRESEALGYARQRQVQHS